jgi:hypothetical protein
MTGPFKMNGHTLPGIKQRNIGGELKKKYKGKSSTTDKEGKLKYGAPKALTQEQRSDLQEIIEKNQ